MKNYGDWVKEIELWEKECEKFQRQGRSIVRRYKDERDASDALARKFNIFAANVGILQASLYARFPKAHVQRRFGQSNDDPARVAALMIQNCLMQDMDEPNCDFDQAVKEAVEDWLVPGLGQVWVRLQTETEELATSPVTDPESGKVMVESVKYEQVTHQEVIIEHVFWEDFMYSPCRTWKERRWVGRKVYMDRTALVKRFGAKKGNACSLNYSPSKQSDDNQPKNLEKNQAIVYEIWDRISRHVVWLSRGYNEFLDSQPDPLKLEGFDPCPKPLFAQTTTSNCMPKADYILLQDQYSEMDIVNNRISLLVQACKVVGVYDQSNKGIARMLQEGVDNQLIPVDNWAMFAEKGGMKGTVDWLPLEQIMAALERLRQAREDVKSQIYELTGISDIVRGNTKASETLGAQQLKANYANVRFNQRQDDIGRFTSEILNIKAEIICKHFTPKLIIEEANFKYYYDFGNQQVIQQAIDLIKSPDHDKFEWRVKVQSDSMAQNDYTQQRQDKVEFTNAVATYLQSTASVLQNAPMFAPIVLETLKFVVSGFKGSQELEGVIDRTIQQVQQQMQQPKPPPPPPPQVLMAQAKMKVDQQKAQLEAQGKQQDMQIKQQEFMMKQQEHQQGMVFNQREHMQALAHNAQAHDQRVEQDNQKAVFNMMAKIAEQSIKEQKND